MPTAAHHQRRYLKTEYGALYDLVTESLFSLDPLRFQEDPALYEPEVDAILLRLPTMTSAKDLARVIRDVFLPIGAPSDDAGFDLVARRIWRAYQREKETA